MSDAKLEILRHRADSGVVKKSRGLNSGETMIVKNGSCFIDNLRREIRCHYNLLAYVVFEKKC